VVLHPRVREELISKILGFGVLFAGAFDHLIVPLDALSMFARSY
jgi:hypothetical protein